MAVSVAVKLKVGHVDDFGSVWLPGMVVHVSEERAKKLVETGEAEYVKPEAPAPKPAPAKEKQDK